jgi:hypothetical protein
MGVLSFSSSGVDFIINRSALRERVYCDGVLVSDVSVLAPRLVTTHRFSAGDPRAPYELRTYEPGGWVVLREGRAVASQRPGWGYVALFAVFAVLQGIDFAIHPEVADFAMAALSTVLMTATLLIHLLWRRAVRAHTSTTVTGAS